MTKERAQQILRLRSQGGSYAAIAKSLDMSVNTIKAHCRRNGLSGNASGSSIRLCLCCGHPVPKQDKVKRRKFCSDTCRVAWWNKQRDKAFWPSLRSFACANCGNAFQSATGQNRKYCSHACYIAARFQRGIYYDARAV